MAAMQDAHHVIHLI